MAVWAETERAGVVAHKSEYSTMAIYRILQRSAFSPEDVQRLTSAYEQALAALQLVDRQDPVTELIAKKIIEVAQTGVHDAADICTGALRELGLKT